MLNPSRQFPHMQALAEYIEAEAGSIRSRVGRASASSQRIMQSEAIETSAIPRLGFHMGTYFGKAATVGKDMTGHGCGTVACIAGWAYAVKHGGKAPKNGGAIEYAAYSEAVEFFGLPDNLGSTWELFHPSEQAWGTIKPAHAVKVLRHLAKTGEVDWSVANV